MKKTFITVFIIILSIIFVSSLPAGRILAGTDDGINLSGVKSFTMENGVQAFCIMEELPQLLIIASIGFGKMYEGRDNAGISDLLAKTLVLAGSKKYPAGMLHETIEGIGGVISISSSWEETSIIIRVLARHADLAFGILSDLLLNPDINPVFIEKARSLMLEELRRKKDDPDMLAFEKLREIIFDGSGYGAVPTEKTVKAITARDLSAAVDKYICGKNIIVGISSSIPQVTIDNYLKNSLSRIRVGNAAGYSADNRAIALSVKEKSKKIYLIPKDIPQATITIGTVAPSIRDKASIPLTEMDYILGGSSFNSRLMTEIRVKRGLSYAVQSILRFRKNTGIFIAFAQTKSETAAETLSLLRDNINLMAGDPVSDEELKWTKESIKNSYVFEFDTPQKILGKFLFSCYNGLPESYHRDYIKNIESVSKEDILKYSRELIGSGLVTTVVGSPGLKNELARYGEVVIVRD